MWILNNTIIWIKTDEIDFKRFASNMIYWKHEINIFLYLQSANLAASLKSKSARRPTAEAASGWSNDIDGDDDSGYVIDYKE